jgi:hypothetical protein
MMHRLDTSIEIDTSAERVWEVLMDFPQYERWNPFVRSIEGTPEMGQTLIVRIQPSGSGAMKFRSTVLAVEPCRELRWKGKLLISGLFDGEHYYTLEPRSDGGTVFRHGELFTGAFVPLFRRFLDGATKRGFIAMNEALKREAEKQ